MIDWIRSRDRRTWIVAAEIAGLGILLLLGGMLVRLAVGLPLLAHLGWSALTSVPVGHIPGPPPGVGERRRNYHLRYRVVAFLNQVQRVEQFVQRAKEEKLPDDQVKKSLRSAERRLLTTAGEVVKVLGKYGG